MRKKNSLLASRLMLLIILAFNVPNDLSAQNLKEIKGIVKSNGNLLSGVSVTVKSNPTIGVITDGNGNYNIKAPENSTLVFGSIGYKSIEMPVNGRSTIAVNMDVDDINLEQVVVIGYGSQRQKKITGAIGSVSAKDISGVQVTGLDQAIQGRIAGVQVTQNSGEPGGSVSVRIRGVGSINSTNEPLYVIDGVPYGSLNAINPNDIERIDVLKDAASASIYGSRASNGVVLVTTKRGKAGKLSVTLDAYTGMQKIAKKLDLLNGSQFAKLANENLVNSGITPNPAWSNPATVLNNDWQSSVLRTAPIQNYNVSISGGGEKSSTLLSLGYFNQAGIVVGSEYKRYTVRLNTDYTLSSKLKVGMTLNGAFIEQKAVGSQGDAGVLSTANYMQPTSPIRSDINGFYGLNPDGSINQNDNTYFGWEGYSFSSVNVNINYTPLSLNNPLHAVKNYSKNPGKDQQILAAAFADYEIIPGLKFRTTVNLSFENSFNMSSYGKAPKEIEFIGPYRSNSAYNENWVTSNQLNWVNTLSYNKSLGKHNIAVVAGTDALKAKYQFVSVTTAGAPNSQQVINASSAEGRVVSGYPTNSALLSYFGRVTYDYAGKYLLSASLRRDGSSKFAEGKQYGIFPAVSVGWRISEEEFLKSSEVIDELKLRASYGSVGNQNIPNFKYLATYSNNGGTYQYTLGQTPVNAMYADNIGDPNIQWEKSTQTNIGADASFLKNKFSLTVDYYIKRLEDLLGDFPIPYYTGVNGGSILRNGFSMENKGFEFALGYNERLGKVNFSANGNFSTLENKVIRLTENEKGYIAQPLFVGQTRTLVGERMGTFWGYVTNGIIQNERDLASSGLGGVELGDRLYVDQDKNGIINDQDQVKLGNGMPKYNFGLNLRAEYKGVDLSVFLNGQGGVQIADMSYFQYYNMRFHNTTGIVNGYSDLLNRWTGPGTSNRLPRNAYTAPPSNRWFSSFYIQNGAFLRIRNVQLGYTLPERVSQKARITHARVYIAAQNLYTFTKYKGYDPEIGSPNTNALSAGVDYGRYPLARMLTIGLNCQF